MVGIDENDDGDDAFGELFPVQGNTPVLIGDLSEAETYIGVALAQALKLEIDNRFNLTFAFGPIILQKEFTVQNIITSTSRGATYGNEAMYYNLQHLQNLLTPISLSLNLTHP